MSGLLVFILFYAVLFGLVSGAIWRNKGGGFVEGFLGGFVLGVFGLIYVVAATPDGTPRQQGPAAEGSPTLVGGHEVLGTYVDGWTCNEEGCGFSAWDASSAHAHRLETGARLDTRASAGMPVETGQGTHGERLRELALLHAEGVVSDEEFAAKKAQLLEGF